MNKLMKICIEKFNFSKCKMKLTNKMNYIILEIVKKISKKFLGEMIQNKINYDNSILILKMKLKIIMSVKIKMKKTCKTFQLSLMI